MGARTAKTRTLTRPLAIPGVGEEPRLRIEEVFVVPLAEDRVQVRGATGTTVMRGLVVKEMFPLLFPLLDGTRRSTEIVDELRPSFAPERVLKVLAALEQRGLLRPVEDTPKGLFPPANIDHYEAIAGCFQRYGRRYGALTAIRLSHVAVIGGGPMAAALVPSLAEFGFGRISLVGDPSSGEQASGPDRTPPQSRETPAARLAELGVTLRTVDEAPRDIEAWREMLSDVDVAAVLVNGPVLFYPWLEKFNAAALQAKVQWTSAAVVDGTRVHVGPSITPGNTACYKCFEMRFKSNMAFLDSYRAFEEFVHHQAEAENFACLPAVVDIAASLAALELVRLVDPEGTPQSSGCLLTLDSRDYSTAVHPVLKIPRCPACSSTRCRPRPRVWS